MSTGGEKERDDVLAEHETDTESDGEEFSGGDSGGDSDGDSDSSEGLALVASVNGGAASSGAAKRAREESNEASASGAGGGKQEEGDGDSDNDSVGEVTVDFQFQDPREIHYLSVKRLLGGLLPGTTGDKFAVHELADAIVNQAAVGTMVTADETGDAYAFITAINFNLHKKLGALSFLKKYLLQRCPEAQQPILQAAFDQAGSKQLGLLLNERMVNTPYQLAPVLHSALVQDLDWAVENEISEEHRKSCQYSHFLLLAHCFSEDGSSAAGAGGSQKRARREGATVDEKSLFYYKFEEDMLAARASLVFTFPVTPKINSTSGAVTKQYRRCMLVPYKQYRAFAKELETMFPPPQEGSASK